MSKQIYLIINDLNSTQLTVVAIERENGNLVEVESSRKGFHQGGVIFARRSILSARGGDTVRARQLREENGGR